MGINFDVMFAVAGPINGIRVGATELIELAWARVGQQAAKTASSEVAAESEIFFRAMSNIEAVGVSAKGQLSVQGESFVTQNLAYVEQLAARHPDLYPNIIKFEMQSGTRTAMEAIGARNSAAILEEVGLGHLPKIQSGMQNVIHVKGELGAVNFGLRQGSASIFNSRIQSFSPIIR